MKKNAMIMVIVLTALFNLKTATVASGSTAKGVRSDAKETKAATVEPMPQSSVKDANGFYRIGPVKYHDIRDSSSTQYYGTFRKMRAGKEYNDYFATLNDREWYTSNKYNFCASEIQDIDSDHVEVIFHLYPDDGGLDGFEFDCPAAVGTYTFSEKSRLVVYGLKYTRGEEYSDSGYVLTANLNEADGGFPKITEFDLGRGEIGWFVYRNAQRIIELTNNKDGFFAIFLGYKKPKIVKFDPYEATPYDKISTMGGDVILVTRKLSSEGGGYKFLSDEIVEFPKSQHKDEYYHIFNETFYFPHGNYVYYIMYFPAKYMVKGRKYGFYTVKGGLTTSAGSPSSPFIVVPK